MLRDLSFSDWPRVTFNQTIFENLMKLLHLQLLPGRHATMLEITVQIGIFKIEYNKLACATRCLN